MKKTVKNNQEGIEEKIEDLIDDMGQLISLIKVTQDTAMNRGSYLDDKKKLAEIFGAFDALTSVSLEKAKSIEKNLNILIGEPV